MGDARNNPGFVHGDTIEAVANLDPVKARCNLSGIEVILSKFKANMIQIQFKKIEFNQLCERVTKASFDLEIIKKIARDLFNS